MPAQNLVNCPDCEAALEILNPRGGENVNCPTCNKPLVVLNTGRSFTLMKPARNRNSEADGAGASKSGTALLPAPAPRLAGDKQSGQPSIAASNLEEDTRECGTPEATEEAETTDEDLEKPTRRGSRTGWLGRFFFAFFIGLVGGYALGAFTGEWLRERYDTIAELDAGAKRVVSSGEVSHEQQQDQNTGQLAEESPPHRDAEEQSLEQPLAAVVEPKGRPPITLEQAKSEIAGKCRTEASLLGASVFSWQTDPEKNEYVLDVVVDESHADEQKNSLEKELESLPLDRAFRVSEPVTLPLSTLIQQFSDEVRPELGRGWVVAGAYFRSTSSESLQLELYGRVIDARQAENLKDQFNLYLDENAAIGDFRQKYRDFTVSVAGLQIVEPTIDEIAATEKIRSLLKKPELAGAWVDLLRNYDHFGRPANYVVDVILDNAEQLAKLTDAFTEVLGKDAYAIRQNRTLPITELVSKMRTKIAEELREGCWLGGAYYDRLTADKPLKISLYGRVFKEAQRDSIVKIFQTAIADDDVWRTDAPELTPSMDQIRLDQPSPQLIQQRDEIRKEISESKELDGVWFDLAECRDRDGLLSHFDVELWVDSANAVDQRDRMQDLLKEKLKEESFRIVREFTLPLSEVVAATNEKIKGRMDFAVKRAYFASETAGQTSRIVIALVGTVPDSSSRESLSNWFLRELEKKAAELHRDQPWPLPTFRDCRLVMAESEQSRLQITKTPPIPPADTSTHE